MSIIAKHMRKHFRNEREEILLSKKEDLIRDIFSRLNYSERISFAFKSLMKRFFSYVVDI